MTISRDDVLHVAKLSRLELTEPEIEALTRELGSILDYVRELAELGTDDVPPTAHVALDRLPLREDTPEGELDTEAVLGEAPRTNDGGFAVPAFVDDT